MQRKLLPIFYICRTNNKHHSLKNYNSNPMIILKIYFVCKKGVWSLAPAYNLTLCGNGYNGEHATSVNNHGNPTIEDILDAKIIDEYEKYRDYPAMQRTTQLGVALRFGTISIRKCVAFALQHNQTWLSELIWREFFFQILYHFPKVVGSPFKEKYDCIQWRNDEEAFNHWCEGKTGYPMVDAGMRQLNRTGYMHNRVRMLVASFLCKNLLIDWRWGEAYFAQKLNDFDLSANNGNWQWAAG